MQRIESTREVSAAMKRILILALVIPIALFACFDDDDPAGPDENGDASPYSGTFTVTSTGPESDCNFPALPPGSPMQITVSGDVIAIGSVIGIWDDTDKSGTATSAETCVPIGTPLDCVRCFYYTFEIQYSHPDTFAGTYTVIYEHSVECEVGECYTIYAIEGVR
jgi:hypothetical protein